MIRTAGLCALLLCVIGAPMEAADRNCAVSVDCGQLLDGTPQLWGHVNVSRRAPPPPELCALVEEEFGRPEVTRCWLMLDQMWDYRTGEYRFNYEINKDYYEDDPHKRRYGVAGVTTGLHYHDYIDSVSRHSETVLLNIRRYEPEVLGGMLSYDEWKEVFKAAVRHYKQRCPNLRYIEVMNEPTAKNQSNIGTLENYYPFYRRAYQAINELNAEMDYELPLLVGGNAGFRTKDAIHLVRDFARDTDPGRRLDFISFHHYWADERPAQIAEWEREIDAVLEEAGLPTDIPIFVTEIGYAHRWKDQPEKNLWQACGMTAYQYYARRSPDLRLFPWVQYHSRKQIAFVQFDTDLRMTPYGAAVRLLRMHRDGEVAASSDGLEPNGDGLGALATMDGQGLTVHLWNLRPDGETSVRADVTISNLPEHLQDGPLTLHRYLVDTSHSNILASPEATDVPEVVETRQITGASTLNLTAGLEPMAITLWQIEKARVDDRE